MVLSPGRKATGIWPFNSDIFTDADFLGASVTDRPFEEEVDETNNIHDTSRPSTFIATGLNFVEANPSSVFTICSPEKVLPYPKAGKRKQKVAGKKKVKTMLATDSPNRQEIERKRQKKKRKKM